MALETPVPRSAAAGNDATVVAGVALFTEEPEALVGFYSKVLRIVLTEREHEDGRRHWITSASGVQIEIKALRTKGGDLPSDVTGHEIVGGVSRAELSFRVSGVSGAVARAMVSGGQVVHKAETFDWGTFAVVLDPDGNRVGLFEPPATETSTSTSSEEGQA